VELTIPNFRAYVFALLFYKRINDVYLENVAALEKDLGDPDTARDRSYQSENCFAQSLAFFSQWRAVLWLRELQVFSWPVIVYFLSLSGCHRF
jgi:hypothetical protein